MLITNHVLAGALIGNALPPGAGAAAGFVSHLVLDNAPHWGAGGPLDLAVARKDGVLGLGAIALCAVLSPPERRVNVLAGIFGSCLPDTDKLGEHFVGRSPWPAAFDRFHKAIQREAPDRFPIEVGAGLTMLLLATRLLRR